jgi:RNA polymerase sigma factor CnrH
MAAAKGDQRAFASLALRHGPALARTVRAMGVEPSEVEDVTQAALVSAWRALADFEPGRSFPAWACVIAANKARDWRRRRRVRAFFHRAAPLTAADQIANLGDEVEALERRAQLRRTLAALEDLPEKLRVPLVMVSVTGLSQTDAAKALGLGIKAFESRVLRARRQLADAMAAQDR